MSLVWKVSQANLDPQFLADVTTLLSASPYGWAATYAYRTYAQQNALYQAYLAGGPEAAPAGESAHEHGLAIDIAWQTPGGGLSWDYTRPEWKWLWAAVRAAPRLHSGQDFPTPDPDHIEARRWAYSVDGQPSMIASLQASGAWGKDTPPEADA